MNTIEETIKMAGFGKKKAIAGQIKLFEDRLSNEGESLLGVCASKDLKTQLYVTDKRVILHEVKGLLSNAEKSIPLGNITSIDIDSSFVFSTLKITTSGNAAVIDGVSIAIANEIKAIIEHLKTEDKKPEHKVKTDTANELRELKGLLDDGILTQDEFDAKKKQLLGI
ncbi:MAG: SHOCT domain-containing protein [Solibacillus sp.]|uniref:SHOCT domain-containing protein n=1 Tax=Solibacillus sp. TaxID=1909654 RepID=UPI0033156EE0